MSTFITTDADDSKLTDLVTSLCIPAHIFLHGSYEAIHRCVQRGRMLVPFLVLDQQPSYI